MQSGSLNIQSVQLFVAFKKNAAASNLITNYKSVKKKMIPGFKNFFLKILLHISSKQSSNEIVSVPIERAIYH